MLSMLYLIYNGDWVLQDHPSSSLSGQRPLIGRRTGSSLARVEGSLPRMSKELAFTLGRSDTSESHTQKSTGSCHKSSGFVPIDDSVLHLVPARPRPVS